MALTAQRRLRASNSRLSRMTNTPQVSYTRGTDLSGSLEGAGGIGGLLARSHSYASGNWTNHNFYHADGNGNITYMVDTNQTMVASYRYRPFGKWLSTSGSLASANVYRFSSKEIHPQSGMYNYGYRFYDPDLQRWVNGDPFEELGFQVIRSSPGKRGKSFDNMFSFVVNNPVGEIDALGLTIYGKNCTGQQKKDIEAAKKDICAKARQGNCFRCLSNNQKKKMENFCDGKGRQEKIECDDSNTNKDCANTCGNAFPGSYTIHLCFNNLNQPQCPGGVGCTLLHEAVHALTQIKGSEVEPYGIEKCAGCSIPAGQPVPPGY